MSNHQINSEAFLSQINQGNFRTFNIVIAKILGSINSAVLFADLVDCQSYHKTRNELISHEKYGDGWFFYTVEKCEERTTLTERQQSLAFSSLKEYGLVESANFGVPCKRHFKINVQAIFDLFNNSNNVSSSDVMSELDPTKGRNCIRHNVGTIYEPKNEPEKEVIIAPEKVSKKSEPPLMPAGGNNNFFEFLKEKNTFTDSERQTLSKFPEEVVRSALKYVFHPTTHLSGEKAQFKMMICFCKDPSKFESTMKSLDQSPGENKKMTVGEFIPGKKYNGKIEGFDFVQDQSGYGFIHPNGVHTYMVSFKESGHKNKFMEICNNLGLNYAIP